MSGRHRPEVKGHPAPAVERPVIWTGQVPPPRWFGGTSGRLDLVNIVMVVVLLINAYFGYWVISILLVTAIAMRWYLLRRQASELSGLVQHEVSPKGIRRGTKEWDWEEFSAWTVLKTKNQGVLDLVLRTTTGSHIHFAMPEAAQPHVEILLDKRLTHYVP